VGTVSTVMVVVVRRLGIERGHEVIFERSEACNCERFQLLAHTFMGHWDIFGRHGESTDSD